MSKIIWTGGQLLTQQHLQTWEQQHQDFHLASLTSGEQWGVINLTIDEDALSEGLLIVNSFKFLTPEQQLIELDPCMPTQLVLDIRNFSKPKEIFLSISKSDAVCGLRDHKPEAKKYGVNAHYEFITDRYDSESSAEIPFGSKIMLLSTMATEANDYYCFKIGTLNIQEGTKTFVADGDFPCKDFWAQPGLSQTVKPVVNVLEQYVAAEKNNPQHSVSLKSISTLIQRIVLRPIVAELKELIRISKIHPRKIYNSLCKAHSILYLTETGKQYYDHYNPRRSFNEIATKIINVCTQQQKLISIQHKIDSDNLHHFYIHKNRESTDKVIFYLVLDNKAREISTADFINYVKVFPKQQLDNVLKAALPGIQLIDANKEFTNEDKIYCKLKLKKDDYLALVDQPCLVVSLGSQLNQARISLQYKTMD